MKLNYFNENILILKVQYALMVFVILNVTPFKLTAQNRGPEDFSDLVFTDINGAPKLSRPILVLGNSGPTISQGYGLAAPAFWDWDGDGLKDLLIGEFGSGIEFGRSMGNFIRVYQNIGTESSPQFTNRFYYARPPFMFPGNGTPLSADQFCCMGFSPQFVDLDADGLKDMITGQYHGEVSWFRAHSSGFSPGEVLLQAGNPRDPNNNSYQRNQSYWLYSSASFGDFTNDGKLDLILGGSSLRISKNIGTTFNPSFSKRELLLDTNGKPLKIYTYDSLELEVKKRTEVESNGIVPVSIAGDDHLSPYVVDWDGDGVLDLLVSNSYLHQGLEVVDFFRGVIKGDQYRFQEPVPLFVSKNHSKAFPGSGPRIFVTDWNNDGVNDLLIGISAIKVKGRFNGLLSWSWENLSGLHGAGKDPSLMLGNVTERQIQMYKNSVPPLADISIDDFMTIQHEGYVYVMLGSRM